MDIQISGKVIHGKKRGKLLGFPTANMMLNQEIPQGIYISQAEIDGRNYQSVTFVGNAKTFGEKDILVETYILSFTGDLYDKTLTVSLLKKIRDNQKFDSQETLVAQIEQDIQQTKEYFS